MKYRILYVDEKVNGPDVVPALQVEFETEAESPQEAAKHSAQAHPFDTTREFWIIPANQITKVKLRKTHIYEEQE